MLAATASMDRRVRGSLSATDGVVPPIGGAHERDAEHQGREVREPVAPGPIDPLWWDAFLADDDECDPMPEPGDFWVEADD